MPSRLAIGALALCIHVECLAQPRAEAFLATDAWLCHAVGFLSNATDRERQDHGCFQSILSPTAVAVLEVDRAVAFVCLGVPIRFRDGAAEQAVDALTCGYALSRTLVDAGNQPISSTKLQAIASRTSIRDAHKLPR